ncbi:MAG: zf-HC2 domain-containing protein, partial [Ruminococcus sp.]
MKTKCNVIRDLIPLYAENLTSEESNNLISEHLLNCE